MGEKYGSQKNAAQEIEQVIFQLEGRWFNLCLLSAPACRWARH